jgi:hypothetical protein
MKFSRGHTRAAKLTAEQVHLIRQQYADGATQRALSDAFGVTVAQIGRIVRGEVWKQFDNPAAIVTGDMTAYDRMTPEQRDAEAEAIGQRLFDRMQADLAKARKPEQVLKQWTEDKVDDTDKGK